MYKFRNDIITHAPTSCLVEDYQTLQRALDALEYGHLEDVKELVSCTMECLASVIDNTTRVPEGTTIVPSPSSLIAMSCREGLLTDENGNDFRCDCGREVSLINYRGVCQCDESCWRYHNGCKPDEGRILLEGGFLCEPGSTKDEEMLKHLETLSSPRNDRLLEIMGRKGAGADEL